MALNKVAIMNKARENYRIAHDIGVKDQAEMSYEQYKDDPLFVAGVMLYWAEGTRLPSYKKYQLSLANSDPELLKVYCNFLRNFFGDVETSLRVALYIYQDIDESEAKLFWSTQLKIPLNQFIKTQVLPSRSVLTKTKLPYGTCSVYISSKDFCWTMQIWIERMSKAMRG